MKLNLYKLLSLIVFSGSIMSCDFAEINTNPNEPTKVPATNLFGSTFTKGYNPVFDTRMNCYYAGAWSGQISAPDYECQTDINNNMFDNFYAAMYSCVETMKVAEEEGNVNLYAAGLVMKVFYGNKAVNCWGDIPYSEAFMLKSEEKILHPKYDSQKSIYEQQLKELEEAVKTFDPAGKEMGPGDFLFNGDVQKWIRFANSLRLRIALRAASGEKEVGLPTIQAIMGNMGEYPLITENDDNAYWWFPGIAPDEERWYKENVGQKDKNGYKISKWRSQIPFVEALRDNNDPRLSIYLDKNKKGEYNGFEFGVAQNARPENRPESTSAFGDRFCADPSGFMPLFNAAESHFNMAEAYLRGYVAGGSAMARSAYEAGITASCLENGVEPDEITRFLEEPAIRWSTDDAENMQKIALQRWIVLFKQSIEAWTEVRRMDVPVLDRIDEMFTGRHNRPPFRMVYPEREKVRNENFPEIDESDWDFFYGPQLWWDKREGVF